jgi:uncharacterized protein YcfJ
MIRPVLIATATASLALGACTTSPPMGPTVMALPRQGENINQFQGQDNYCRNYAAGQINYQDPAQAGVSSGVGSAVLGTALGAAAGAALGAIGGNAGAGAAIGGAGGLLVGGVAGSQSAASSQGQFQQRYNMAYTQCMVAAGYTVQGAAY